MTVEKLIDEIIAREGGYVNHPDDRGGETNYGITEAVARANGYGGAMRAMSRSSAVEIYRSMYWLRPQLDSVARVYPKLAAKMFDVGVNMGPVTAVKFLQRSLNALQGSALGQDGDIGKHTLAVLAAYKTARGAAGEEVLFKAVECLQGARYIELVERRPRNRSFIYGWLRTRIFGYGG